MSGYTPAFDTLYTGTLYGKWPTAAVWASLLPLVNKNGVIDFSYEAISGMTGWPMELLRAGIAALCQPDPDSRSDAEEGKRLALVDPSRPWGWRVINHSLYRERARKQFHNAQVISSGSNAERMKTRRDQTRPDATAGDRLSYSDAYSDSDKKETETRASRAAVAKRLPDDFNLTPERRAYAEREGLNAEREFEKFCDHWKASGGSTARKRDWEAAWRLWCRRAKDMAPRGSVAQPERTWRPGPEDSGPC